MPSHGQRIQKRKQVERRKNHEEVKVLLQRIRVQLDEVIILPGINPAHRIIQNAIDNKDHNDPEKLKSFSYTSYDKMIFTVNADSLLQVDTALLEGDAKELVEFFGEKDIFRNLALYLCKNQRLEEEYLEFLRLT